MVPSIGSSVQNERPEPSSLPMSIALSTSSVGLAWKATGDDGTLGRASGFELRYAAAPINTAAAWDAATPVTGLPLPGDPGDAHTFTVGGLSGDTEYFFCVRVTDDEGQQSPLGPGASATTFPTGTFLSNLAVTPEFGDDEATYTFTVLYSDTDGDAPVTHDLVLDGTPVVDVKPYLAYADAFPDASAGWLAARDPIAAWEVTFSDAARAQLAFLGADGEDVQTRAAQALALGPEPHAYRRIRVRDDGARVLSVKAWRVTFATSEADHAARRVVVTRIDTGYRARELERNRDPALDVHRAFVAAFGPPAP